MGAATSPVTPDTTCRPKTWFPMQCYRWPVSKTDAATVWNVLMFPSDSRETHRNTTCWPHSAKRLDSHREKHETSRNPESWNCSGLEALCRRTASAFRDLFGFQEIRPVFPQWRHHPHGSHCQALEALFAGGLVPNSQLFGIFSLFLNPRV